MFLFYSELQNMEEDHGLAIEQTLLIHLQISEAFSYEVESAKGKENEIMFGNCDIKKIQTMLKV